MVARGCTDVRFGFCIPTASLFPLLKTTTKKDIVTALSRGQDDIPEYMQLHEANSETIQEGEFNMRPFDTSIFLRVEAEFRECAYEWKGFLEEVEIEVSEIGWYKVEYTL
jgi:hypothetical protein